MWEEGVLGNSVPCAQFCCEPKTALKKQSIKKEILSVLAVPGNHLSFYCLHNVVFSRMSNSWNHTVKEPNLKRSYTV